MKDTYFNYRDHAPEHPGLIKHQNLALDIAAHGYSSRNHTDGRIPKSVLSRLTDLRRPHVFAAELVACGLWRDQGDYFEIVNYLELNRSEAEVDALSRAKAEAGRIGGARCGEARRKAAAKQSASALVEATRTQMQMQINTTPKPPVVAVAMRARLQSLTTNPKQRRVAKGSVPLRHLSTFATTCKASRRIFLPPRSTTQWWRR